MLLPETHICFYGSTRTGGVAHPIDKEHTERFSMFKEDPLESVFESFLSTPKIFKDRDVLRPTYVPDRLPHRDTQIRQLGQILATALKSGIPSNILLYGKTGTGKTAACKHVMKRLKEKSSELGLSLQDCYMNCQIVDTNYGVLRNLCEALDFSIPHTGLATAVVFAKFRAALDLRDNLFVIVLDEVDRLVRKNGDETLYNLTRINTDLQKAKISLIGISNDLKFKESLDPRVLSSLSEEEIVFPPYKALELRDILEERAKTAFYNNTVDPSVISLCAALAAREHGDARRALDLLRVAGELAERAGQAKVKEPFVRNAKNVIERDTVLEVVTTLPLQSKLVLNAIYFLEHFDVKQIVTGEVYEIYTSICRELDVDPLTQRRISDLINELDMLGIINAKVVNLGRYGRTKKIRLAIHLAQLANMLDEDPQVSRIRNFIPQLSKKRLNLIE